MTVSKRVFTDRHGTDRVYHTVSFKDANGKWRQKNFKKKSDATAFERDLPVASHVAKMSKNLGISIDDAIEATAITGDVPISAATAQRVSYVLSGADRLGSIEKVCADFIDARREGRNGRRPLNPQTVRTYEWQLKFVTERFAGREVASITRRDVEDFRDYLLTTKELSRITTRDVLAVLRSLYKWLIEDCNKAIENPCLKVTVEVQRKSDQPVDEDEIYTSKEVDTLLSELDRRVEATDRKRHHQADLRNRLMVLLAFYCGLRNSEIRALQWKHLDLDESVVKVRQRADRNTDELGGPKSKTSRRDVPLTDRVKDAVRAYRPNDFDPEGFVFATLGGGDTIIGYNNSARAWEALHDAAGVRRMGFHTARHFFASKLIDANYNVKRIANLLGHTNESFTLRVYGHLIDKRDSKAKDLEAMGSVFT